MGYKVDENFFKKWTPELVYIKSMIVTEVFN